MNASTKIGAVTVTYNSERVIDDFLASVLAQKRTDFILYLVDNNSRDRTLDQVSQYRDSRIQVIANRENHGFAEASNQGIRAALGDGCSSVLLINNDTEFDSNLFAALSDGLMQHQCDMAAPKILYHHDRKKIWSAGGGFTPWKGYGGFHFGLDQIDRGQFDQARVVKHAPACCLLIKSDVFERIGFMDSRFFVYLDDTDFCYRAFSAGLKIIYLPSAVLLHKASALTGGPESEFSVRYRTRNQIYFMLKHLGVWRALFYLVAFQMYQLTKFALGKFDLRGFVLREKAFAEGLKVWMEAR